MRSRGFLGSVAVLVAAAAVSSACSLGGSEPDADGRTVVLLTHDSFAVRPEVLDAFRAESGIRVDVRKLGDAGKLVSQLVLTKANPLGDVAFGVDNTFASRALTNDVFTEYTGSVAPGAERYDIDDTKRLTPIDVGDVCVNIDPAALAAKGLPEPTGLADLIDPRYKGLTVVEDPATSSPGLAFLLATVATFDDGWTGYWQSLRANDVKVTSGWEEAYTQDFSGSAGKGPRPIVVSYASSPAAEGGATKALLNTCFRQVEYAGVLAGKATDDTTKVVEFLQSEKFQAEVADQMYVYPVREGVALPAAWQSAAPLPRQPTTLSAEAIEAGRDGWVNQWRSLVQG